MLFNDYVAEVDTDPEPDPPVLRHLCLSIHHPPLHLNSTTDGIDHAREFRQHAVARVLDDPTAMVLDLWLN